MDPWLSFEDIQKGARWFDEVGSSLEQTQFGIICLTKQNLNSPWVLFEAGALSKSLAQSRVTPLLIDLKNSDLSGPLAQFQTTLPLKAEVWKLVLAINQSFVNGSSVSEQVLSRSYEKWWPDLDKEINEALQAKKVTISGDEVKKTPNVNLALEELIETNRALAFQTAKMLNAIATIKEESASKSSRDFESYGSSSASKNASTVRNFALELRKQPEVLLEQFRGAGVRKNNVDQVISDSDKQQLLSFLQSNHGTQGAERKKITVIAKAKK